MSVVVGFSGGVDSSTVVAWAKREGLEPIACVLAMREGDRAIPSRETRERARRTAEQLGVAYMERDVSRDFLARVIEPFAMAYAEGRTPNPCSLCNRELKVKSLIDVADELGAEKVLTGHYARIVRGEDGISRIARAADASKDQSYFLARLTSEQVARLEFPLATLQKREVRETARALELPAAEAPESMGVCFASDGSYKDVISEVAPRALEPGEIVTGKGEVLGLHQGIASVTVGQRKGLSLSGGPWFVNEIDARANRVIVQHGKAPRARALELADFSLNVPAAELSKIEVRVATHYRTKALLAKVVPGAHGHASVAFLEEFPLAAPGQSSVLYSGDIVIGEGTIEDVEFQSPEGDA